MRRFANPVRYRGVIVVEAILLTLLIHAGLLFLFSYEKPEIVAVPDRGGSLMLLPTASFGPENKPFTRWLNSHDPTVIARSSSALGYAAMMPRVRTAPDAPPRREEPTVELPTPGRPVVAPVATGTAEPLAVLPTDDPPVAVPERFPVAELSGARVLNLNPSEAELVNLVRLPSGPTKLIIERSGTGGAGAFRRFRVVRSSGDPTADVLAAQLVLRELNRSRTPEDGLERLSAVVYWRKQIPVEGVSMP